MEVVRDLLDSQVVDRNGCEMGRVDSIVLEVRRGARPRLAAIEIGPAVLAARVHPFLGRLVKALEYACGFADDRPIRIAMADVLEIEANITVDAAVGETMGATRRSS